jgi:hypothetical protein
MRNEETAKSEASENTKSAGQFPRANHILGFIHDIHPTERK